MTRAIAVMELRLRTRAALSAASGLLVLTAIVGGLYPSLGDSIGKLDLPQGVGGLVGGSDFSSITGWLRTEITSVYGPIVVVGLAVVAAASATAGEEEDRILALVLAHPVPRWRFVLGKAAAIAITLAALAVVVFGGMELAVALAGSGVPTGHLAAAALHLFVLGVTFGALALALGASTGRRGVATGGAAAAALAMYLVNGLAPSLGGLEWLRYLSLFHYYEKGDPLGSGVDPGGLLVLLAVAFALTGAAVAGFARRDLRG